MVVEFHVGSAWSKASATGSKVAELDPDSSSEEFRSSLQSDIHAVLAVDAGWEELTHDTDAKSLISEMRSWISDSLMPAAQFEIEGNPGPPLAGERRSA